MALAPFFDKAALSAATLLNGFDRLAFEQKLGSVNVGVIFELDSGTDSEQLVGIEILINLLARLYPTLSFHSNRSPAVLERMRSLALRINPQIEIRTGCEEASIVVSTLKIGQQTKIRDQCPVIYMGSDGWIAKVATLGPLKWGKSENTIGAAAAGAIAAANVFRYIFRDQLPHSELDSELIVDLLSYSLKSSRRKQPRPNSIDLTGTTLIGAGAIGNAVIWMLSKLKCVKGAITVIDHESIELSNLQRYVLTDNASVNMPKVGVIEKALKSSPIQVMSFLGKWAQYTESSDWNFRRLAVAVDSIQERVNIAGALPMELLNAWTQVDEVGVSRHCNFGREACLCCLYFPDRQVPSESEVICGAIGFPKDDKLVRDLLQTGRPLDRPFLERVAGGLGIGGNELFAFEGASLRRFYSEAICGGITLRLGASAYSATEVPTSFQSALAGIFLAAEIVVSAGQMRTEAMPSTTRVRVLQPIQGSILVPVAQADRCICRDRDYIDSYARKYKRQVPQTGASEDNVNAARQVKRLRRNET